MRLIYKAIFTLFILSPLIFSTTVYSQNKFKLKSGARGELCLECHADFQDKLTSPYVHTPIAIGECAGCHNPHASTHGKLLTEEITNVCYNCHEAMTPEKALSTHKVVVEGNCVKCHDPHASDNEFNLLKAGNELCFECHEGMRESVTKVEFGHPPVEAGCINCHNPHGSAKAKSLLKEDVPLLCKGCHKTDRPIFSKLHKDYPVAEARCTTCHNPHGSDRAVLLYDNVHMPVANKMCNQCHEDPASPTPFKTRKEGFELCRGCHYDMVNETFNKNMIHWPLAGEQGCLSCHKPHASKQASLLKEPLIDLCGKCHPGTIDRQNMSPTKHEPVNEGNCTACHSPHASDNILLLSQPAGIDLCGNCHEWRTHSTHPIGENIIDPRNPNSTLQCLSCHRAHGTEYKQLIPFPTSTALCIQCHKEFKR